MRIFSVLVSLILFSVGASAADSYDTFKCHLSADFGEMDAPLEKDFVAISKSENYFQTAEHFDLKITALYDEAGTSYTVEASGARGFHLKTTIPYFPDADLRFTHEFNDKSGKPVASTEFVVQCTK